LCLVGRGRRRPPRGEGARRALGLLVLGLDALLLLLPLQIRDVALPLLVQVLEQRPELVLP
jgi:hypothetical protein